MLILASYRFTHLIVFDKITEFIRNPFMIKKRVEYAKGKMKTKKIPKSNFGYLLNCYWCAGIWSAIIMAIGYIYLPQIAIPIIFIFSIAGAQAILETFVGVGTKIIDYLTKLKETL
jgi:hypothetical protein